MSGTATRLPMAPRDDGLPVLTPEQAKAAAPGSLFRTTDGRIMRVRGGQNDPALPVMTPEQALKAAPGTLFRTTDGRLMRARGGAAAGAPPANAAAPPPAGQRNYEEGQIARQNGKTYIFTNGDFVEAPTGGAPAARPAPASAPIPPPSPAEPRVQQTPRMTGAGRVGFPMPLRVAEYEDPAPTGGLTAPEQRPSLGAIMSRNGPDPWVAASDYLADAAVSGVRTGLSSIFSGNPADASMDNPMPPSTRPVQPQQTQERMPMWRGLPSIPSWSERAKQRYGKPAVTEYIDPAETGGRLQSPLLDARQRSLNSRR